MRRILHASDFSPASRAAFRRAVDVAKAHGAELLLVHVLTAWPRWARLTAGARHPIAAADHAAIARSVRAHAQGRLDALCAKARDAGVRARGVLAEGVAPHVEIGRIARSSRADMIVVGTHGRHGLDKFFLGSVAQRVMITAPCAVMTVRPGGR